MKRAAWVLALALVLQGAAAHAGEDPRAPDSDAPATSKAPSPDGGGVKFRAGAVGAYRGLYDLSILGAGAALSLGAGGDLVEGCGGVRYIEARTAAGLTVHEFSALGTVEWKFGNFRVGVGGGPVYFDLVRATGGPDIRSLGHAFLARVGYEFGSRPNAYVFADIESQAQAGAAVWGPTLQVGASF